MCARLRGGTGGGLGWFARPCGDPAGAVLPHQRCGPVLAFAASASAAAAIVIGLAPAFESRRLDLVETMRANGRAWFGRVHRRTGAVLVAGEIALAFVLVTSAALTARTLARIENVPAGFEPQNLLTFQLAFGQTRNPAMQRGAISEWEEQLAHLPGVQRAGATSHLPLDDFPNWYSPYRPDGAASQKSTLLADYRSVTPGYPPPCACG